MQFIVERNYAAVCQFHLLGVPDVKFNNGSGYLFQQLDNHSQAFAVGGSTTGEIYIAGIWYSTTILNDSNYLIFKLDSSGQLDRSFGFRTTPSPDPVHIASSGVKLLLDESSAVVFCGISLLKTSQGYSNYACFGKFDATGKLDSTFGNSGCILSVAPVDKILCLGKKANSFYTASITMPGVYDGLFLAHCDPGGDVVNITSANFPGVRLNATVSQFSAKKFFVAGTVVDSKPTKYFVACLNEDGKPDITFGVQGIIYGTFASLPTSEFVITALWVDAKSIYIVGGKIGPKFDRIVIAKHDVKGPLDLGFSGDGKQVIQYVGASNVTINSIVAQTAGSLYLSGVANGECIITSMTTAGVLNTDFGNGAILGSLTFNSYSINGGPPISGLFTAGEIAITGSSNLGGLRLVVSGTLSARTLT